MGSLFRVESTARPYTLLTGATGLLGQYLLRDLLQSGQLIAVLVRPTRRMAAGQRIEQFMQRFEREGGSPLPRPVVLEGDISAPGLGLEGDDQRFARQHCGQLIHNAALLQFSGLDPAGEPWRTNVHGTRNVLDFCRDAGLRRLHYMSTAYVCGRRTGQILEDEFDCGQEFRNDYERSKFQAEQLVRAARHLESATIYRPVVVSGDSRTGYTCTYHGLFVYLRLFAMFVPHLERGPDGRILTDVQVPLDGDEPRNVVPVDWVSGAFCRIFSDPALHGRTYHLAPETRLTARQVFEAGYEYFNSHGVEFCGSGATNLQQPEYARQIMDQVSVYSAYETSDPEFDTSRLKQAIGDYPSPEIDRSMILRYLRFGESDRWGKRPAEAQPGPDERTMKRELLERARSKMARHEAVGVRMLGAGGGDWTVRRCSESGDLKCTRGLAGPSMPVTVHVASLPTRTLPVLLDSGEPEMGVDAVQD